MLWGLNHTPMVLTPLQEEGFTLRRILIDLRNEWKKSKETLWESKENREQFYTGVKQYYTNADIVDLCVEKCRLFLKETDLIIEPAAGDGAFLDGFKKAGFTNQVLSYDIEPKRIGIIKQDFLLVDLSHTARPMFAITNPPFGRMNKLSVRFFLTIYTAVIVIIYGFIVPISWRKWTVHNRLNPNFHTYTLMNFRLFVFINLMGSP